MKINYYTQIQLNILIMGVCLIFLSFIPELFPSFFGDWHCQGTTKELTGCDYSFYDNLRMHNPTTHFGYRHWIFIIMGISLIVVNSVRISKIKKD